MSEQRIAERKDALKLLEQLATPCKNTGEHSWRNCNRCLAIHGIENKFPLTMKLLRVALDALSASPAETGLSLSIQLDPLAVSEMLDDSTREREMYHRLVNEIRTVLGDDGLHAQLLDLPNVIAAKLPAETGRASETSGWRTFWGVIGPRGMPCLFGPHRDDVDVIDDDERIALFQVKEIAAPPPSASSATD